MAVSGGYPGDYAKGYEIDGLDKATGIVFHAGTTRKGDAVLTSGGRVLAAVALGEGISDAAAKAYDEISAISFRDMYYRRDISKDLQR